MCDRLVQGGDWEAGWAVFLAMRQAGLTPSTISYNALISACERCGQPDRCARGASKPACMHAAAGPRLQPPAPPSLLRHDHPYNATTHPHTIATAAPSLPPPPAPPFPLRRALEVFASMQRRGQAPPNAVTFNTLISACAKAGRYAKARELHAAMAAAGIPEDVFTLSALITGVRGGGWWAGTTRPHAAAWHGWRGRAGGLGLPSSWPGRGAEVWVGDPAYPTAPASHPPRATCTCPTPPTAACERIGHWQGAEDHFVEFQARGVAPNTVAYNRLISALGRSGEWQRAVAAFRAMQPGAAGGAASASTSSRGSTSGSGSSKVPASGGGGGGGGDEFVYPAYVGAVPARPDRITYGSLIAALERGGQWQRALAVFEEMQAAGMQVEENAAAVVGHLCSRGVCHGVAASALGRRCCVGVCPPPMPSRPAAMCPPPLAAAQRLHLHLPYQRLREGRAVGDRGAAVQAHAGPGHPAGQHGHGGAQGAVSCARPFHHTRTGLSRERCSSCRGRAPAAQPPSCPCLPLPLPPPQLRLPAAHPPHAGAAAASGSRHRGFWARGAGVDRQQEGAGGGGLGPPAGLLCARFVGLHSNCCWERQPPPGNCEEKHASRLVTFSVSLCTVSLSTLVPLFPRQHILCSLSSVLTHVFGNS